MEGGDIPLLQRERAQARRGLRDGPQQGGYLILREPRIPGLWPPQQPRRLGRELMDVVEIEIWLG